MALYTTLHLHNVPDDKLADYAAWFDGPHREALARLRGLTYAERFEITEAQLGDAYQPWRFMSVYDFDYATPEIDLPALGPLLADARDAGLITARRQRTHPQLPPLWRLERQPELAA